MILETFDMEVYCDYAPDPLDEAECGFVGEVTSWVSDDGSELHWTCPRCKHDHIDVADEADVVYDVDWDAVDDWLDDDDA